MKCPRAHRARSAGGGRPPFECAPPRAVGVRQPEGLAEALRVQDCDQWRPLASSAGRRPYCSARFPWPTPRFPCVGAAVISSTFASCALSTCWASTTTSARTRPIIAMGSVDQLLPSTPAQPVEVLTLLYGMRRFTEHPGVVFLEGRGSSLAPHARVRPRDRYNP